MKAELKIITMCLSGMISSAKKEDQELCIKKIHEIYGEEISNLVKKYLA